MTEPQPSSGTLVATPNNIIEQQPSKDVVEVRSKSETKNSVVGVPQKRNRWYDHTAIIFDWDDTLLCSSYLLLNNITLTSQVIQPNVKAELAKLERCVCSFLHKCINYGAVIFIITNAESGWVELSAKRFMPKVYELLGTATIVSARSCYQHYFPNNPTQWKMTGFSDKMFSRFLKNDVVNCISLGDSECERNAILSIGRISSTFKIKNLKLVERPTCEQLIRQLEMLINNIDFIVKHEGNLDLMLTISNLNDPSAPQIPQPQPESHKTKETVAKKPKDLPQLPQSTQISQQPLTKPVVVLPQESEPPPRPSSPIPQQLSS